LKLAGEYADLRAGSGSRWSSSNVAAGRLKFTTDLVPRAIKDADAVFIAVGTPSRRGDGHADLSYVYGAAKEIAGRINGFTVIVDQVDRSGRHRRRGGADHPRGQSGADFAVVSNPEFLREGAAIDDFKRPDRVVDRWRRSAQRSEVMRQIYRPLALGRSPIIEMSRRGAELTKYAGNAFLATKITFINEIADLCEKVGADVQDVARGIGLDNRIGGKFLHAGPGYGGSCFPKDTLALLKTSQDYDAPQRIVEAVVAVNDNRKRAMGRKVIAACGGDVRGKTIAVLGLTFKPNTDDMRDSPAIAVVQTLQDAGAKVRAYDPEGMEQAKLVLDGIDYCTNSYEAMEGADALVIVTEWDAFRALDLDRVKSLLSAPILVDLRNVYPREMAEKAGFSYTAVGR
jgi:UDPglucose 6-dehydrogenase